MKRCFSLLTIALLMMILAMPTAVSAANASVQITGNNSVETKKEITVIVTYQAKSIGFVNGQLHYDINRLSYISGGTSKGDNGLVQLKAYSNDAKSKKLIFKIKFKAVNPGATALNLETLEIQNLNNDASLGTPRASKEITVLEAKAITEATGETETGNTVPEITGNEIIDDTSSDKTPQPSPIILIFIGLVLAALIALIIWQLKKK